MTFDYLNPEIEESAKITQMPVVNATDVDFSKYGRIIKSADEVEIEIVRWPASGWRPVDTDSGDEGGTTEGNFIAKWDGDILFGSNEAVGGEYILGYSELPHEAQQGHSRDPAKVMLWHVNYHPDGGQLFMPLEPGEYFVPLALPGDDVSPQDFKCFRFESGQGCYIHPNIWHEGVFPKRGTQRFFGRQGRVHARVSADLAKEFNTLLCVEY